MSVTIRDVNTNEEIIIPPEGLIFGRTGGDADVQLDDNTISRRQARVSLKGGNWLVETIAVAQGQRPPRPVTLVEGQTFIVGQSEFEVVNIAEAEQEEEEPAPPPKAASRPPAKAAAPSRAPTQKAAPAANPAKKPAPAPAKRAAPPPQEDDEGSGGGDEAAPKSFGAMFVAVPKGIAYYLVNVPKMLFNPLGTVRSAIDEMPAEPMGRIELIGYALPALLASGLLGSIAGGLALLIGPGHIFSLMSFIPIVPAISAVIGAIITGFVFHPVLKWIVNFLKGESNERSRTNYFLQTMTLSVVLAVPNALGVILGSLPIPFINLLGPLLMTVASLVSIYVTYQWFVAFNVVKWFRTVILVLGALSVLGAAFGFVMGVINTIRGFGSHTTSAEVTTAGDAEEAVAKAQAEAEKMQAEAMKAGGAEAAEAVKKAQEQAAEAIKKAQAAGAAGGAEAAEAIKKAQAEALKAQKKAQAAADEAEKAAEAEAAKPGNAGKAPDAPEPANDEPKAAEPVAAKATKAGSYGDYARKRDLVEKALANDPTVLDASHDLQELYGDYLKDASEIDKKWQKEIAKNSNKARLYEHLRDAELYKKTGSQIDDLAKKLKLR